MTRCFKVAPGVTAQFEVPENGKVSRALVREIAALGRLIKARLKRGGPLKGRRTKETKR